MPNVRGGGQVTRQGYHNSGDIKKTMKPEYARDDINEAFAGEENEGPAHSKKDGEGASAHVKSRKTKDKDRTPLR